MSDDLRNRVERAIQAVEIPESGWPEDRAGVWLMALDEAVKAADAALAEIGAVRVKPLEWKAYNEIGQGRCHYGSGVFGHWYAVSRSAKAQWSCSTHHAGKMRHLGYLPTLEDAKAAAQADYEARILAAIEPAPVSVREAAWSDLVSDGVAEAEKAMTKFPQPNYVISKVAEEAGEVVKAAIHCAEGREDPENVRSEMKQLIAMLYRLWIEGDQVHGLRAIAEGKDDE